uniref:Transthyretin-like family protein n=1 Tax=Steinernema glaseri TaxID=37863 RepID=A0A1I7ZPL6_9BILA
MRCFLLVFAVLYQLWGPTADAHPTRIQGVAVKGRLLCGSEPLAGAKVKIIDVDTGMDPDDLLDEGYTDSEGRFELNGATREATDIDAVIKVYHDCNDGNRPCQRKVLWEVPNKYIHTGSVDQWFDVGTVNMEIKFRKEERDCRH